MSYCVSELERSHITQASEVLARAFMDDPMVCAILGGIGREGRLRRLRAGFEVVLKIDLPGRMELCVIDDDHVRTCALVSLPGAYPPPISRQIFVLVSCIMKVGPRGLRGWMIWNHTIRRMHPRTPHLYLEYLGTDPTYQGRGFGSILLKETCALADENETSCYLETTNPRNLPFYEGFGFSVIGFKYILGVQSWFLLRPGRTAQIPASTTICKP